MHLIQTTHYYGTRSGFAQRICAKGAQREHARPEDKFMILNFRVSNYRSFRDEVMLSVIATRLTADAVCPLQWPWTGLQSKSFL